MELALIQANAVAQKTGDPNVSPPSALVNHVFDPPFVLPPATSTGNPDGVHTTPEIPNVLLARGLVASLGILGSNLDFYLGITAKVGGDNGYTIPYLHYQEIDVETQYTLSFLGGK